VYEQHEDWPEAGPHVMNAKTLIGKVFIALTKTALLVFGLIERFDHSDAWYDIGQRVSQI
jgi:hypothetical protein